MQEPVKIQLAIQGGGAKIVCLVAAMESIQLLEDRGVLKVTRISGTSAGAIVGCLFAAGIRMDQVRLFLQQDLGRELVRSFPQPRRFAMASGIVTGKPFWRISRLEKWLKERFEEKGMYRLEELNIPVSVVASDLGNSGMIYFEGTDRIVSSIMDSCGLPYYLRMWNYSGPVYVDGGICENLPIKELQQHEAEGAGPIVALSFGLSTPGPPRNVVAFSKALIDTAINNSIERAKNMLNPNSVHTILTNIGTFDFAEAIRTGLEDSYELIKTRADIWFRDFVSRLQKGQKVVAGDPWRDPNATASDVMKNLGQVYAHQHFNSKFKYKESTFEVQANCLLEEGEEGFGEPDKIRYLETFQPLDEAIYCLRVRLAEASDSDDNYLGRTRWEVRNANGEIVKSVGLPMYDENHPMARYLLIFFDPVLRPNSGEYTLDLRDNAFGVMKRLISSGGGDEIVFTPSRAIGTIGSFNLVLYVPNRRGDLTMVAKPEHGGGRPMIERELGRYEPPFGFRTLGWTGTDVDIADIPKGFGVDIIGGDKR